MFKHSFDKSMKTFIEHSLYSEAAKYGIRDAYPIIICGPEAKRTHQIATNTGIIGRQGAVYVERNTAIYSSIKQQLSNYNVSIINDDIKNLRISNFINYNVTGSITADSGKIFNTLLERQTKLFGIKAIIYTFALRPISLVDSLSHLDLFIQKFFNTKINIISIAKLSTSSNEQQRWSYETGRRGAHCRSIIISHDSSSILSLPTFYYNSGGGHMLTGAIIYK